MYIITKTRNSVANEVNLSYLCQVHTKTGTGTKNKVIIMRSKGGVQWYTLIMWSVMPSTYIKTLAIPSNY